MAADRKEEVARERRRRDNGTLDRATRLKLAVPEEVREKHPESEFRWVNDTGARISDLTQRDDWDKVDGVQPVQVGTDEHGKPIFSHLCRKPREYIEEDRRIAMEALKEREAGLLRGQERDPKDDRPEDVSYVPPGNTITTAYTP